MCQEKGRLSFLFLFLGILIEKMDFEDNRYSIQGIDLIDLASEFGTPLYVYDGEKINDQFKSLSNAFTGLRLKIKYAINIFSYLFFVFS